MITCNEYCYPCCDYCIYVIKELQRNGDKFYLINKSCEKHPDNEHYLSMVLHGGYCKDFICKNIGQKEKKNESC